MWNDLHDAQMRANNTVVRFNDKPVYIKRIEPLNGEITAFFIYLLNGQSNNAPVMDARWNWKPVPTGYVNTGMGAVFLMRKPVRKWKQGLAADNVQFNHVMRVGTNQLLRSRNMGRMIVRDYPSFDEAREKLAEVRSCAFHPEFALVRMDIGPLYLNYRGDVVGWFEKDEVVLGEEYRYLNELIQEVMA